MASQKLIALGLVLIYCGMSCGSPLPAEEESLLQEGERSPRAKSKLNSSLLDKINVDNYLRNERAVKQQIKCILRDNAPCDAVGKEMKRLMPMIVHGTEVCDECTPQQKEKIQKIIDHMKTKYPKEWEEGLKKYGASEGVST